MSRLALVYGASGYTGALVSQELSRRGISHVVAGRTDNGLRALADSAGHERRVFSVDSEGELEKGLDGVTVLLNCAGPFSRTSLPLAKACIKRGVAYLDLAGEADEHLALLALDRTAKAAGTVVVPGVGFGVVPTEIAAALAVNALDGPAASLEIAYETKGDASRGTLETVLGTLHHEGFVRRDGRLVAARAGDESTTMDFGSGPTRVVSNPWRADLVSAFESLDVPTISTFATFPFAARVLMRLPKLLASRLGRRLIRFLIDSAPRGPSEKALKEGFTRVLARATSANGTAAIVRIRGPEAYVFTARTAAEAVVRTLRGLDRTGFSTPSQAFGLDLLSSIEGVEVTQ